MPGWWMTSRRPASARIENHRPMIGPKRRPTAPVPKRWIANSIARMTSVIGTTSDFRLGRDDLQALDGREHRDRRRDHPVAVEQRRPEDAERHEHGLRRAAVEAQPEPLDERDEGHDPALAVVVGAHDEGHVLDRDDDRDRPEDERDHAVDAGLRRVHRVVVGGEDRLQRIERAGTDVAEDHAEGADREGRHARLVVLAPAAGSDRCASSSSGRLDRLAGSQRRGVDVGHPRRSITQAPA